MANKICPSCGKEQDAQNKFCKNCGALLTNENTNIGEENLGTNNDNTEDAIFEDFIKGEKDYSDAFINDDVGTGNNTNTNSNNVTICPVCREKVESGNYCIHCGSKVNMKVKRCVNCGSVIDSMAKVCPKCGYNIIQKVPIIAAGLSFLFAGLGQYYNNQHHKAALIILCNIISLFLILIGIGVILVFIIWIYAIYDAFQTAKAIDRGEPTEDKLFGF